MYQLEVTTEDALTRWYESVDSRDGNDSSKRLRGMVGAFSLSNRSHISGKTIH